VHRTQRKEAKLMADAGPPLTLIALGLILWLAVDATLAGISIQLIGVILFVVGVAWLVIEIVQSRAIAPRRRAVVVRDEPVPRDREMY
jgi:tetrahydromethanopterin S-methyltransferase subunit E